jgi:hypothetical protein
MAEMERSMNIKQSGKRAHPAGQYTIEAVLLVSLFVMPAVVHVLAVVLTGAGNPYAIFTGAPLYSMV